MPGGVPGDEQLRYDRVMFEARAERAWMEGFMMWDVPAGVHSAEEATAKDDCAYGKPAGEYLRAECTALAAGVPR
uniref:glycoside hydrolase family 113 n=1 Tax=Microbacterium sp. LWH7-1.2 TaxID=3135257 RepID=UPI00405354A4